MDIKKVVIHNIGCINNLEIKSTESNVVIIKGGNAAGKTTTLAAISSLFSKEELFLKNERNLKKDSLDDMYVEIYFDYDENSYALRRSFIPNAKFNLISNNPFKGFSNLFNVYYIDTESLKTNFSAKQLEKIQKFMEKYDFGFTHILRRNTRYFSGGELTVINIIYFLSLIPSNSIVLADSIFSGLDSYCTEAFLKLFKKLDYIRFFVATKPYLQLDEEFAVVDLEENQISNSAFYVNYEKIHTSVLSEEEVAKNDELIFAMYKQGTIVNEEEDFEVEFKEVKGSNPCDSILKIAEQYIVAFLNSPVEGTGVIKWGINNDGVVKGVTLNRQSRDNLRTGLQKIVHEISPPVTSNLYNLQFREVVDSNENILSNTYIVELKVKHAFSKRLYSTGKGEVYIKANGVKQKLNSYEVQLEVLERNKIDNKLNLISF